MISNLTKIEIPEHITEVGKQAFYGCENLTEVVLCSHLAFIGARSSMIARPKQELKGFMRLHLDAKETKQVEILLTFDAFKYYYQKEYILEKNVVYDIMIGGNLKKLLKKQVVIK